MSGKGDHDPLYEREERESQESTRAEPDWTDIEASKAWLEERYPLLADVSLGSPLFRYMKACIEDGKRMRRGPLTFFASRLALFEALRYSGETDFEITFDPKIEKLYPGYGFREPIWGNKDAAKVWLEQRYPLGDASRGSPLYQYMQDVYGSKSNGSGLSFVSLGEMLTDSEWKRFLSHCPDSDRRRQHVHSDKILYPQYDTETPGAMDIDSDDFNRQESASPSEELLAYDSKKRSIDKMDDEQPASSPTKKRRASTDTSGHGSLVANPPKETPLADSSRKRSIEEVEDAPLATSTPKRKRSSPKFGSNELPPSSSFDPPEQSVSSPLSCLNKTPTQNRTAGAMPDSTPLDHESPSHEDPTTAVLRPNDKERPALQSGPRSEATDGRRNPAPSIADNKAIARQKDLGAAQNIVSKTQERRNEGPSKPAPQGDHQIHVEESPEDMTTGSEHPRDRTSPRLKQDNGVGTKQTAISTVMRESAAKQELSPDEDVMNVPIIRTKHNGRRRPSTKGRKAPPSQPPQREQRKRKPLSKGHKNRESKPEREQQAYMGRLRVGVGERKHRKPRKYSCHDQLLDHNLMPHSGLVMLEFKGRKAFQVRAN